MRLSTLSAIAAIGATSAGQGSGLEPNNPNLDSILSPVGYSRDLGSIFKGDQLTLLNKGFSFSGGDGVTTSNQLLLALMRGEGSAPSIDTLIKPFPKETGPNSAVIEDFEEDFSNWKLSGSSFSSAMPFDGQAYNKRATSSPITGFEGKQFAFSYSGRNQNTGKAESKEFEIKWDQISFDIMGGTTNTTRMDLVIVENGGEKAVRTASGDGTLSFKNKSWKVKDLKGKTAKLVITDDSEAASYGFVGVDNIRGESAVSGSRILRALSPEEFGGRSYFSSRSKVFVGNWKSNDLNVFGVTDTQMDYLCNEIFKKMISPDLDHIPNQSLQQLAKKIEAAVDATIKEHNSLDVKPLLRKWLLAEGVCGWVSTHVVADSQIERAPREERFNRGLSKTILSFQQPSAICGGFNTLTRELSACLGLDCKGLGGEVRNLGSLGLGKVNHGWNYFDFGNGIFSLADNTQGRIALSQARAIGGKTNGNSVLPRTPAEVEYFMSTHFATQLIGEFVYEKFATRYTDTEAYACLNLPYSEWINTSTSYQNVFLQQYKVSAAQYVSRLNNYIP